ncbi:MAG: EI24 domain-containing protein [Rhodospirillales bacterium]|nr:EI24 domain-containing protein [Rhodospirillales bacterium]
MGRIISAYFKGFEQLADPRTRAVILASIAWSGAIFIGLLLVVWFTLGSTVLFTLGWLEGLVDVLGGFATLIFTWLLFPAVVTAVGALMLDRVVGAVEQRHYPHLAIAPGQSFAENLGPTLKFLGVTVGLNLLCLPLLFIPPLFPFVYYALNGYLLSREYFEMVALRRVCASDAEALRQRWKTSLFIAGVGFAFMLTVPILNVIAPIIATAATVHLFEAWRAKDGLKDKTGQNDRGKVALRTPSTNLTDDKMGG